MLGEVVKLDRKFPLVRCEGRLELRCEESAKVKKGKGERCVIGDRVEVSLPEGHEFGVIERILPRETSFVRRDPVDRATSQVLAANFSQVVIIEPFDRLNIKRIERELVLAHETGANVAIALSKSDTVSADEVDKLASSVRAIAGPKVKVYIVSSKDKDSIKSLINDLFLGETSILLGQSGAGKSTLINELFGEEVQATGDVREGDGKGRHTTVSRSIINLPTSDERICRIVDMPGVRGLGLWDAQSGIDNAFIDIAELAADCRFRDCRHENEPGCAVKQAVEERSLTTARLQSYLELKAEMEDMIDRRERATWKNR